MLSEASFVSRACTAGKRGDKGQRGGGGKSSAMRSAANRLRRPAAVSPSGKPFAAKSHRFNPVGLRPTGAALCGGFDASQRRRLEGRLLLSLTVYG